FEPAIDTEVGGGFRRHGGGLFHLHHSPVASAFRVWARDFRAEIDRSEAGRRRPRRFRETSFGPATTGERRAGAWRKWDIRRGQNWWNEPNWEMSDFGVPDGRTKQREDKLRILSRANRLRIRGEASRRGIAGGPGRDRIRKILFEGN